MVPGSRVMIGAVVPGTASFRGQNGTAIKITEPHRWVNVPETAASRGHSTVVRDATRGPRAPAPMVRTGPRLSRLALTANVVCGDLDQVTIWVEQIH